MAQNASPKWITKLQHNNPKLAEMYLSQSEKILKDGAIPAKYKILMTMIVDAITAHPDGCFALANRARAAGASEAEINEAIEVAYLFGGTPALVTATNALGSES
ncbi:MAG: carboxymuconolactone decarboxylase family protein [Deltaproteobacteria bacterium]|nr:MAG: carboxymuconolactone decarboxylase family protein [Deltaproteobacteria bacterium]